MQASAIGKILSVEVTDKFTNIVIQEPGEPGGKYTNKLAIRFREKYKEKAAGFQAGELVQVGGDVGSYKSDKGFWNTTFSAWSIKRVTLEAAASDGDNTPF